MRGSGVAGLATNPSRYTIANVSLARSDSTWARFDTLPAAGQESTYQGGFGLAHCDGTSWAVTDFGTAEVGCPGGTVDPAAPGGARRPRDRLPVTARDHRDGDGRPAEPAAPADQMS